MYSTRRTDCDDGPGEAPVGVADRESGIALAVAASGVLPSADRREDPRRLASAASVPASGVGGTLAARKDSASDEGERKPANALGLPTALKTGRHEVPRVSCSRPLTHNDFE